MDDKLLHSIYLLLDYNLFYKIFIGCKLVSDHPRSAIIVFTSILITLYLYFNSYMDDKLLLAIILFWDYIIL